MAEIKSRANCNFNLWTQTNSRSDNNSKILRVRSSSRGQLIAGKNLNSRHWWQQSRSSNRTIFLDRLRMHHLQLQIRIDNNNSMFNNTIQLNFQNVRNNLSMNLKTYLLTFYRTNRRSVNTFQTIKSASPVLVVCCGSIDNFWISWRGWRWWVDSTKVKKHCSWKEFKFESWCRVRQFES